MLKIMREIKFRAFDTNAKVMREVLSIWHNIDLSIAHVVIVINKEEPIEVDTLFNGFELMQFTGFKAVHKKTNIDEDVYEGDIFRQTDETDDGDETTYHVVMWLNERGAFYMIPCAHYEVIRYNGIPKEKEFNWLLDDAALYDFSFDVKLIKVGNIHENPELLNA